MHFKLYPHTKDLSRSVKNYGVLLRQKIIQAQQNYEKFTNFFKSNTIHANDKKMYALV